MAIATMSTLANTLTTPSLENFSQVSAYRNGATTVHIPPDHNLEWTHLRFCHCKGSDTYTRKILVFAFYQQISQFFFQKLLAYRHMSLLRL